MTGIITGIIGLVGKLLAAIPVFAISKTVLNTGFFQTIFDWIEQVNFIVPLKDIVVIIGINLAIIVFKSNMFFASWISKRVNK